MGRETGQHVEEPYDVNGVGPDHVSENRENVPPNHVHCDYDSWWAHEVCMQFLDVLQLMNDAVINS